FRCGKKTWMGRRRARIRRPVRLWIRWSFEYDHPFHLCTSVGLYTLQLCCVSFWVSTAQPLFIHGHLNFDFWVLFVFYFKALLRISIARESNWQLEQCMSNKFVGTPKKVTTHVNQNEDLMFEKSSPGKKAYR